MKFFWIFDKQYGSGAELVIQKTDSGPEAKITINVPLRSGQFKGSKKSWPPQNVPWNGS